MRDQPYLLLGLLSHKPSKFPIKYLTIDYLEELTRIELEQRNKKHVQYLLKSAKLPRDKLLLDFDKARIPTLHSGIVQNLSSRGFVTSKKISWFQVILEAVKVTYLYHSTILELNSESYRIQAAKNKGQNLSSKVSLAKTENDAQTDIQMEDKNVK